MDSRVAISEVLNNTFNDLLWIIEYREGDIAEECIRIVIDTLTGTLNKIKRLYGNEKKLKMFRRLARTRLEFPSLLSLFNKENRDMERCILDGLQLSAELPFSPDPRKTYTPYTLLAMGIVRWISFHSSQQSNSMYRKVVPGIEKMDFCDEHAAAWTRAIEFHLDFYQAPKKTREKTAFTNGLEEDFKQSEANKASCIVEIKDENGAVISTSIPSWIESLGAYGEITRMREFKNLLKSGRDKQITGEGSLYSRVRGKVVEAAMTLMREKKRKVSK